MAAPPDSLPREGPLLGIDPGERRVGLAISDSRQVVARPLMTAPRKWSRLSAQLEQTVRDHAVVGLVVGLPLREGGTRGRQTQRSETLAFHMRRQFSSLPLVLWDERWSSEAAGAKLAEASAADREAGRDAAAAAVILQSFLDTRAES